MSYFVSSVLVVTGLIHLLPAVGVLGADRLNQLYGFSSQDPNLLILTQHRAVLFGLLGVFCLLSVWRTDLQWPALIAGLVSTVCFVVIAHSVSAYNAYITKIVLIDKVVAVSLVTALIAKYVDGMSQSNM